MQETLNYSNNKRLVIKCKTCHVTYMLPWTLAVTKQIGFLSFIYDTYLVNIENITIFHDLSLGIGSCALHVKCLEKSDEHNSGTSYM